MAFILRNVNPLNRRVGDCVIRAISTVTGESWEDVFIDLALEGFVMKDMPSANSVWGNYLKSKGFRRYSIPNACPACYTVKDFCNDHQFGSYVLATGTHAIAVVDGDYIDSWDSGDEVPAYYWERA